jgi:hypothetical protein
MAESLAKLENGRWCLATDAGAVLEAQLVVIAAAGSGFMPKKPPIEGSRIMKVSRSSTPYAIVERIFVWFN